MLMEYQDSDLKTGTKQSDSIETSLRVYLPLAGHEAISSN